MAPARLRYRGLIMHMELGEVQVLLSKCRRSTKGQGRDARKRGMASIGVQLGVNAVDCAACNVVRRGLGGYMVKL